MKHLTKRIAAAGLALCLTLTLAPAALAAEETAPERGTLTYTEVIAPQYEAAGLFDDGLAPVKQNGKWGYINTDNQVVIPFEYDIAGLFNEGYAIVGTLVSTEPETAYDPDTGNYVETGKTLSTYGLGFVDTQGNYTELTCPDMYDWETDTVYTGAIRYSTTEPMLENGMIFHNGYITLWRPDEPASCIYDTTGAIVELQGDTWLTPWGWQITEGTVIIGEPAMEGGSLNFMDLQTGQLLALQLPEDTEEAYYYPDLRPFNQGLAPVCVVRTDYQTWEATRQWGFVDKSGKFVIQPAYANFRVADIYGDYEVFGVTGLAMVENAAGQWGAIDKTGATVIPFQYDYLYTYAFGLAAFEQDGKWGFLDENAEVAIPAQYQQTTGFSDNGYAVVYDGTTASLIDSRGQAIPGADQLDPDTYFIDDGSDEGVVVTPGEYVVIEVDGKYGYGHIEYLPPLPQAEEMSSWAYEEVTAAIEEDLVPVYLQNLYLNNITRGEFCDLTIQAIEETLGQDIEDVVQEQTGKSLYDWMGEYPFNDTSDSNAIAAYALGIVTGRGGGVFDPYASITRQEAAAFLMRSAKVLGMDTGNVAVAGFTDSGDVGVWFTDAVNFVYQINVMSGTGNNTFSPLGSYTREQSYVTIYRLFQAVMAQL